MFQVHFRLITSKGNVFESCLFCDTEEEAKNIESKIYSVYNKVDYVKITDNAYGDLCEANLEVQRLRGLLSRAYQELQFIKSGYNEFISGSNVLDYEK